MQRLGKLDTIEPHLPLFSRFDKQRPSVFHISGEKGALKLELATVSNGFPQDRKINFCFIQVTTLETSLLAAPDDGLERTRA